MAQLRALSIDPGETTGYALAVKDREKFFLAYDQAVLKHGDYWNLLRRVGQFGSLHIVCEDFEFRQGKQKTGLNLYPVELIGITRLFCSDNQWRPLWMQKAAQGKGYYDDNKLKSLRVYQKGIEHGRDAARHLLHWFHFGGGYQFNDNDPQVELVTEDWIRNAYF
jgi:hypothetical protein